MAAPSANRFGRVSPTTAAHVRADLGADVRVVLDGGPCRVGVESTIVDVTGGEPAILRVGGVSRAAIEQVIGRGCALRTTGETAAPGTLGVALRAAMRRGDRRGRSGRRTRARPDVRGVGEPGCSRCDPFRPSFRASWSCSTRRVDVEEYARVLYARLREADERELDVLLVVIPPASDGLGAAVADRVCRASH